MEKIKDPAFLFYPANWLIECADLTFEERGMYMTLQCLQHNKGRLSKKVIGLSLGLEWDELSGDFRNKFVEDENGCFYNETLDTIIYMRSKHITKQRANGALGGRPPKNDNPKDIKDETQNMIEIKPKKKPLINININTNIGGVGEKKMYAESVLLTETEYNSLISKYGQELTMKFITKLDNYKGSSGKNYKSDYRAILSWVAENVMSSNQKNVRENDTANEVPKYGV